MHFTAAKPSAGASARKAEANRANAQHSTGPTSEAGKARSSQNAKRHGMQVTPAALLARPTEELRNILANFTAELRPTGTIQETLVREVAVADYRMKQLDRIQLGVMAIEAQGTYDLVLEGASAAAGEQESPAGPAALSEADEDTQTFMMGVAWCRRSKDLTLLARYQAQARRDFYRALKQLGEIRSGKAPYMPEETENKNDETKPPEPPTESKAPPQTKPANPGFMRNHNDPAIPSVPTPQESGETRDFVVEKDAACGDN